MAIPTQASLAGFIVSDPEVSFTDDGTTRVHFRVGVEHWHREDDGTYTKLDNSFHDLVVYGKTAERAADQLRKGDQFLAHGHVQTYYAEPPAQPPERDAFIARRIGHDLARTTYEVERRPAPTATTTGVQAAVPNGAGRGEQEPHQAGAVTSASSAAARPATAQASTAAPHAIGL